MVLIATFVYLPAIAALTAFLLMDRPWWWGPAAAAALAVIGLAVPFLLYAAAFVIIGWIAAQTGSAILLDESVVAAIVYFALSTLLITIWFLAPDGTFP